MRTSALACVVVCLWFTAASLPAAASDTVAEKRARIDEASSEALERVMAEAPGARDLFEKAYGWAAFDNIKASFGISGGAGSGVAVDKASGERTYMKMGTGGVGLGLGSQRYQVVFLFEDEATFQRFVDSRWQAETGATAAAGTAGSSAVSTFHQGLAVFQITKAGLMASADVSGTKYWKAKKLNP